MTDDQTYRRRRGHTSAYDSGPSHIGDIVADWSARRGLDAARRLGLGDPKRWSEVVGADLARAGDPLRLDGGTLVIAARDEAAELQLQYAREAIRVTLNEVLGEETVRRIVIRRQLAR